jgi:hypothetical protein
MGATTTAQRKEQMEQQALMRIEANAIDTLKQAQADKQVAIATGDTDKAQAADKAIADASTALTKARQEMRDKIAEAEYKKAQAAAAGVTAAAHKQTAETGVKAQKETERHNPVMEKIAAQQAAAMADYRASGQDLQREKLALTQLNSDANYAALKKKMLSLKSIAHTSPIFAQQYKDLQTQAATLARQHGVSLQGVSEDLGVTPPGGGVKVMDFTTGKATQ